VIVTDKTKDEVMFLKEYKAQTGEARYSFTEPNPEDEIWQTLYTTGEYSAPWSVVQQFIVDRGA
jgi:hypothetical protein